MPFCVQPEASDLTEENTGQFDSCWPITTYRSRHTTDRQQEAQGK